LIKFSGITSIISHLLGYFNYDKVELYNLDVKMAHLSRRKLYAKAEKEVSAMRRSSKIYIIFFLFTEMFDTVTAYLGLRIFPDFKESNPISAQLMAKYGVGQALTLLFLYETLRCFLRVLANEVLPKIKPKGKTKFSWLFFELPWPAIYGIAETGISMFQLLFVADNGRVLLQWILSKL